MKSFIRIFSFFLIAWFAACGYVAISNAQTTTASILPPAKTTFFDANGKPLVNGTAAFYIPGTLTPKTTWQDAAETIANTNPVTLDSAGRAIILGFGSYRQIIKDRNGNLIWDQVTSSIGTGGGGGSTVGDGNLVGTILPWSGLIAPPNYLFAYGEEINRATYPEFFAAITSVQAVFCTNGSATLTGLTDTTQLPIGSKIEVSCMPIGTTIVSKTATNIVASNNAVTSVNANATFFPWGNGNGSTTFNVPDFRGNVLVGRPNMGGIASANLTSTYYGANPLALGVSGGQQSYSLLRTDLPNVNISLTTANGGITDPGHTHGVTLSTGTSASGGPVVSQAGAFVTNLNGAATANSNTTGISANVLLNGGVTQTITSRIAPSITTNYIVKVTPDVSTSIATGVASLGGMTGVIACGTGVSCSANTISTVAPLAGGLNTQVQFNNSGTFAGSTNLTFVSPALSIGSTGGATGQLLINGLTSGTLIQTVPSIAGTPTITWGSSSGTPMVTATSPLVINTTTGNGTITSSALTKTDDTNVTLTLGGSPTTSLLSAASLTLGWTGTLSVARGGTGLGSGTSGGIPYFSSTSTIASSGLLTANGIMLGGGAGVAPTSLSSLGTTTTVLHGNAAGIPSFGAVALGTDVSGQLPVANGGTGLASGTSGGIPYFSATNTIASSTLLTANQIMLGGGAGTAPTTFACATSTTVVHGGTPPTCSNVAYGDIATAAIATASQYFTGTASELVQTGIIYQAETTTTFGATTTFDFNTFINTAVTLTGNITTMTLSNVKAGQSGMITFIQDATGSRTTVWNSIFKFPSGATPTLSTAANAIDVLTYSCRSATICPASLLKDVR